jgi:2-iminobutanoate/2-iminopropanoate deaminase
MSERQMIQTSNAPQAIGPYVQAVRAGGFLFVSGQVAIDPANGKLIEGGIEEQTSRVLKNISAILEAAGLSLGNVVKTTVYLADLDDFQRMNQTYSQFFENSRPARATVQVARLPLGAKVEIDAIAVEG